MSGDHVRRLCCLTVATGTAGGSDAEQVPGRALQQAAAAASGEISCPSKAHFYFPMLPGTTRLVKTVVFAMPF